MSGLTSKRWATSMRWVAIFAILTLLTHEFVLPAQPVFAWPLTQPTSDEPVTAVVSASTRVNLREGAGATFAVLARVEPGASVIVLDYNQARTWIRVRVESTKQTGWIAADLLRVADAAAPGAAFALLPTPTPDSTTSSALLTTPTPASSTTTTASPTPTEGSNTNVVAAKAVIEPTAFTRPVNMNVRGGPGTNYPVVKAVPAGTALRILALGPNGDWYQVQLDGVEQAWVFASLTDAAGPLDTLARLNADQVPPAPAAAQTVAPAIAAAPAPAAANAPPPSGAGFFAFGIQAQLWQNAEKPAVAGQIKDLGMTWVKQQLRWEFVENSPGAVNWSEPDQVIEVMNAHGIQVLFSIFTAPQWSRPDKPGTGGPPNDFNQYAAFVGNVAARYCGRLGAIEVWNEQNLQREWEGFGLDPALYMDLLRRAYSSIKANCPSIIVVSGAPTPAGNSPVAIDDVDYLRGMYAHGLAQYSDAVGVHPSGFANPPEFTVQDWQQGRYTAPASHFDHRSFYFRSTMEEYRQVMVANGDVNKRLWPTEFGWGSSSTPYPGYEYEAYISESAQAQYIVRAFGMMRDWGWVGVAFLWNLNFTEGEMAAFRIIHRPAYDAIRAMTR